MADFAAKRDERSLQGGQPVKPSKKNMMRGRADSVDRRGFLKAMASTVAALSLPVLSKDAGAFSWDEFFQKHFYELSREELEKRIKRLEKEYNEKFHRTDFSVSTDGPLKDVRFAYALSLSKCIGCRKCVHACVAENNQHRGSESRRDVVEYIRVLEMEKGSLDLEKAVHDYSHPVPAEGKYYMPVQCHHCNNAPCTKVCPVEATWQEVDGIVVVDYEWCIGCRYCQAACPYFARRFNFSEPRLPEAEVNPVTHYLGNRPRSKGVMEKCTFCIQRTRRGLNPACLDVCPTGSRKFGNLLDPDSEIRYIINNKRVFILKEELGTMSSFYYYFD
ncbi:MAG: 4Fe-4S dicluster domain-containing protein [bacterium]|jgi:molybdopterin-containing oxidoreductase family iron-sulfur binding subunit|nr:4Fe-4S dicluster domain-containing protein [bacterium]